MVRLSLATLLAPMEQEKLAQEQWKSARDFGTTTTRISVVLFAALIASWVGMWDHVDKFRGALESRQWQENQARLAFDLALRRAISGRLLFEAGAGSLDFPKDEAQDGNQDNDRETAKKRQQREFQQLLNAVSDVHNDPEAILRSLKGGDWRIPLLSKAISDERDTLLRQRGSVQAGYERRRSKAEETPFKLLGLEFLVNGFWAWPVWLLFFSGGVLYLSLARRALIRRCRSIWTGLSQDANVSTQAVRAMADILPVWLRPLPRGEPWVEALTNPLRLDATLDPLSVLCIALMTTCSFLSVLVLWMGITSTSLVRVQTNLEPQPFAHAAALCVLYGLCLGLLIGWKAIPVDSHQSWFGKKKGFWFAKMRGLSLGEKKAEVHPKVELLSRRTWVITGICTAATAVAYSDPINKALTTLLLNNPRFRHQSSRRRPGSRAKDSKRHKIPGPWEPGFYEDTYGRIHYVPASGRARSLFTKTKSEVHSWNGPFDGPAVRRVHPSALVPFLRQAVRTELAGIMHRKKPEERNAILAHPITRRRYQRAFSLVQQGIQLDAARPHKHPMPNLQLYDLLGAIAINSNSKPFLQQARKLLRDASLPPKEDPPRSLNVPRTGESSGSGHSHHTVRKQKSDYYQRRAHRLEVFKKQRLEPLSRPTPFPEPPGLKRQFRIPEGTWDVKSLTSDSANNQHVARARKKLRQRKRIHRKKGVRWS